MSAKPAPSGRALGNCPCAQCPGPSRASAALRSLPDGALAMNQRTVLATWDALDRGLSRALEIEPPGLDLGL
jgi:hypothetical protein